MAKIYRARGHRQGDLFYSTDYIGPVEYSPEDAWDSAECSRIIPEYVEESEEPVWTRVKE